MKKLTVGIVALVVLLAIGVTTGFTAEPEGWKFEFAPYLWFAGLEGDATINGYDLEFEKSASDLFDYVETGGSFHGVVQYNRYLLWGQIDYFSLSTNELDIEDRPKRGSLDSKTLLSEVAVGYQFDGWAEGQTIDLLIGVRDLSMENDLELYGFGTASKDSDVMDPILVVRPSMPLFTSKIDGLRFNSTLAIGGGGDSDLVYELFPQLQYQITDNINARFGYRTVGWRFEGSEDNELNVRLAGLVVGLGITF